jgi:aspartate-semialdehyde dehydrogenase
MKIAVVGATGLVGNEIINELVKHGYTDLELFASSRSAGTKLMAAGVEYVVKEINEDVDFGLYKIALFSAGSETSKVYGPMFASAGCYVVDNSSGFRMDDDVALVIPEVNFDAVKDMSLIIANPNCSTIQSVVAIKPLVDNFNVVAIDYHTYQSVSGSGLKGINELRDKTSVFYPRVINENVIPQIDDFQDNGFTFEEMKMVNETRKILDIDILDITATCVRVPVVKGHSVSIKLRFDEVITMDQLKNVLNDEDYVKYLFNDQEYVTPAQLDDATVFVSRIRIGFDQKSVLLFCVADNLKKGAATNAVQIADKLVKEEYV